MQKTKKREEREKRETIFPRSVLSELVRWRIHAQQHRNLLKFISNKIFDPHRTPPDEKRDE